MMQGAKPDEVRGLSDRCAQYALALTGSEGLRAWAMNELSATSESSLEMKQQALEVVPLNEESEKLLAGLLRDSSTVSLALRQPVLKKLVGAESEAGIAALVETLKSADPAEVKLAIKALARKENHGGPEALASYAVNTSKPLPFRKAALDGMRDNPDAAALDIIADYLGRFAKEPDDFFESCLHVEKLATHQPCAEHVARSLNYVSGLLNQTNEAAHRAVIVKLMTNRIQALRGASGSMPIAALAGVVKSYLSTNADELQRRVATEERGQTKSPPLLPEYFEAAIAALDALAKCPGDDNTSKLVELFAGRKLAPVIPDRDIYTHIFNKLVDRQHPELSNLMLDLVREGLEGQADAYPLARSVHCLCNNLSEFVEDWMLSRFSESNALLDQMAKMHPAPFRKGELPHTERYIDRIYFHETGLHKMSLRKLYELADATRMDRYRSPDFQRPQFSSPEHRMALISMLPEMRGEDARAEGRLVAAISLIGSLKSDEERQLVKSMIPAGDGIIARRISKYRGPRAPRLLSPEASQLVESKASASRLSALLRSAQRRCEFKSADAENSCGGAE